MLLIGGTDDGVIANNSRIYGIDEWATAATPVVRTFREAISREQGDSYLVLLEGANHFSLVDRLDSTLQVAALDFPSSQPQTQIRSIIAEVVGLFIDLHVRQQLKASEQLERLLKDNSLIAFFECK